jgi:hypothetical protein
MRRMIAILLSLAALGLSSCQGERLKETSPRRYYLAQSEAPPSDNPAAPFSAHSLGALGYQFFARREPFADLIQKRGWSHFALGSPLFTESFDADVSRFIPPIPIMWG